MGEVPPAPFPRNPAYDFIDAFTNTGIILFAEFNLLETWGLKERTVLYFLRRQQLNSPNQLCCQPRLSKSFYFDDFQYGPAIYLLKFLSLVKHRRDWNGKARWPHFHFWRDSSSPSQNRDSECPKGSQNIVKVFVTDVSNVWYYKRDECAVLSVFNYRTQLS